MKRVRTLEELRAITRGWHAAGEVIAKSSMAWLILAYLFHTLGELCASPVALSFITKLAPARVGGFLMGVFFLSISVGNYMGGRVASFYESLSLPLLIGVVAAVAFGAALVLAVFVKPMNRLTS